MIILGIGELKLTQMLLVADTQISPDVRVTVRWRVLTWIFGHLHLRLITLRSSGICRRLL